MLKNKHKYFTTNNQNELNKLKILQIGMGPLGLKIAQYIAEKESMETAAAVDINPELHGQDLGVLLGTTASGVGISKSIDHVNDIGLIDAVILTTSSSLKSISTQINEILEYGIPIVSTCEELMYPWKTNFKLASQMNQRAKEKRVAIVSTGVNPGFLMDTLPSVLTGVCKEVEHIQVNRIQDAQTRRLPFQMKIGAGLIPEEFEYKKTQGTLRHVGLTESMHFVAESLRWKIDQTEDVISPIIAEEEIVTDQMKIEKGNAMGVRQIGRALYKGEEKIKLVFEAAVGLGSSYDEVIIKGNPNIHSRIEGGVHGDVATCAIVLNAVPNIIKASPGLRTMKDLGIVSFIK